MANRLDIINMALDNLGEKTIDNLNDHSDRSTKIQRFYNEAIRQTLRAYNWSFASITVELAVSSYKSPFGDLPYSYLYPEQAIKINQIFYDGQESMNSLKHNKKKILNDGNGDKVIVSNIENAIAEITIDVSNNEELFDDIFVRALSYQLAYQAAVSICGQKDKRNDMLSLFSQTIELANSCDGNENFNSIDFVSSFEIAR